MPYSLINSFIKNISVSEYRTKEIDIKLKKTTSKSKQCLNGIIYILIFPVYTLPNRFLKCFAAFKTNSFGLAEFIYHVILLICYICMIMILKFTKQTMCLKPHIGSLLLLPTQISSFLTFHPQKSSKSYFCL